MHARTVGMGRAMKAIMARTKQNPADVKALETLKAWYRACLWNRGELPSIGVSMFSVPGLGVPVQVTLTGAVVAYFSSYDAACTAISRADRARREGNL